MPVFAGVQLTALRVQDSAMFEPPIVVANAGHADMISEQLAEVGCTSPVILLEPFGRNTAPAIALAAMIAAPSATLLVMPSDHIIADLPTFHLAVARAISLVGAGWLVTFGIQPDSPETGYGYILLGGEIVSGVQKVGKFIEKPDADRASAMLADGNHVWNAGIFLFRADVYLSALAQFQPAMLAAVQAAINNMEKVANRILPNADNFDACPANSIDYSVMEKAEKVACVPVSMGWSDLGSWDSLHMISEKDEQNNAVRGDIIALGTQGCLIHSDGPRIALVDVDDLIVVATNNDVLIIRRGDSQKVRRVIEVLKGQ